LGVGGQRHINDIAAGGRRGDVLGSSRFVSSVKRSWAVGASDEDETCYQNGHRVLNDSKFESVYLSDVYLKKRERISAVFEIR
jgi:hypothetical protein